MKWQVLASIMAVVLLTVAPVFATVIDFSTDPNLAADWTRFDYYGQSGAGYTQTWNESNQCLDLAALNAEANVGLYKNGTSRSDDEGVTLTLSDFTESLGNWLAVGLIVSQQRTPNYFDQTPNYGLYYGHDSGGSYIGVGKNSSNGNESLARISLDAPPASVKFDIARDGADYVFMVNGAEICRDSSLSSTSLPYYMMFWGASGNASLSVSADNFGVVPEPSVTTMLIAVGFGLICYAWRKRK